MLYVAVVFYYRDISFELICALDYIVVFIHALRQLVELVLNEGFCAALRDKADYKRDCCRDKRGDYGVAHFPPSKCSLMMFHAAEIPAARAAEIAGER